MGTFEVYRTLIITESKLPSPTNMFSIWINLWLWWEESSQIWDFGKISMYLMCVAFILQNNHKFYLILKTCVEHQRRFSSFHSSGGQPSYFTPWKIKGKTHGFSGSLLSLVVLQFILWAWSSTLWLDNNVIIISTIL